MSDWICVEDRLPDKNARYSGEFGVSVLGFDMGEYIDTNNYTPHEVSFNFEKNCFQVLGYGHNDTEWIDAPWITHWMELPEVPSEKRLVEDIMKYYGGKI